MQVRTVSFFLLGSYILYGFPHEAGLGWIRDITTSPEQDGAALDVGETPLRYVPLDA